MYPESVWHLCFSSSSTRFCRHRWSSLDSCRANVVVRVEATQLYLLERWFYKRKNAAGDVQVGLLGNPLLMLLFFTAGKHSWRHPCIERYAQSWIWACVYMSFFLLFSPVAVVQRLLTLISSSIDSRPRRAHFCAGDNARRPCAWI